jgi:hypothetical protein
MLALKFDAAVNVTVVLIAAVVGVIVIIRGTMTTRVDTVVEEPKVSVAVALAV